MNKHIILCTVLLVTGVEVVASSQHRPMAGAYRQRSIADPDIVSAANFAIGEEGRREGTSVSLLAIESAKSQVVAGVNYSLDLSVKANGRAQHIHASVHQALKGNYSLSAWEQSGTEITSPAKRGVDSDKAAIEEAIRLELNRDTPTHVKVGQFTVNSLVVRSSWALAVVTPSDGTSLDPVSVLLRKPTRGWRVVTLGTNLHGAGREFHVPRILWRKWSLD